MRRKKDRRKQQKNSRDRAVVVLGRRIDNQTSSIVK